MTTRRWSLIIGTGLLIVLLALAGLGTVAFAQGPANSGQPGWWGPGGMMGGRGGMPALSPVEGMSGWSGNWGDTVGNWSDGLSRGWGSMMNGWNQGGWRGMMVGGMPVLSSAEGMGGYGAMDPSSCHGDWGNPGTGEPLTIDQATARVQEYLNSLGNPDLVLAEVMEFEKNFYAEVEEESTGVHAFELLVNRYTGTVTPEPGPNMMWNTKYGHMAGNGGMGGMMGGRWGTPTGEMTVTPEQARQYAQTWLDTNLPGTTVTDEADAFYGYYTIHTLQNGQVAGMLSVNGYTGAVWYHTWHGDFIGMEDLDH